MFLKIKGVNLKYIYYIKMSFQSFLGSVGFISDEVVKKNDSGNYIVCHSGSYHTKPLIYNDISLSLNMGIIITKFSLFNIFSVIEPLNLSKIVMWSDVQILSNSFLIRHNISRYDIFQHGAFDYGEDSLRSNSDEISGIRSGLIYVWSEYDKKKVSVIRSDLEIRIIKFPKDQRRYIIDGFGFATRGMEFFADDITYFRSCFKCFQKVEIYFHPSYKQYMKLLFVMQCKRLRYQVSLGLRTELTSNLASKSRSIKILAEDLNINII